MLVRLATLVLRAPRRVLIIAGLLLVGGGIFGAPVAGHLLTGGFTDPSADSTRATSIIDAKFHGGQANLVFLVSAPGGADSAAARATGTEITAGLAKRSDWTTFAQSYWTSPGRAGLRSTDGKYGLVVTHVKGNDNQIQVRAAQLADQFKQGVGDAKVQAGGAALAYHQVNTQTKKDLALSEAIAIPLTAIALILVFGSLIAALVPLAVGIFAIIETLAILRTLSTFTDVSVYAMNMTTALGLALAIDYSLFMVSRYREELRAGRSPDEAIIATVRTAGRTVLFSALTVGLSLSALIVFPMYFLRSFAYAGLAVVALAAAASMIVLPACLALIGTRVNSLDLRAAFRRLLRRQEPAPKPLERGVWYRLASTVMRRPLALGVAVTAVFLLLGAPFLRANFGYPDDRVINSGASARTVGDVLRADFGQDASAGLVGVTDSPAASPTSVAQYSA
ncbi:MAG TPA: MMPL family transporter, partial [Jatrophihabitans sp.]|nr:MMPL family transporter [Jatrophihabitans sp.]